MQQFENEEILWTSKNEELILTTHRLREVRKSIFGSTIKSIMLEELTASALRTSRQFRFLRQAIFFFLLLNGTVYLLNHYLFKSELILFFFGEVHIGQDMAQVVFYISLAISLSLVLLFFFSIKKVFSFYAHGLTIDFQLRWLDFEERESFISKVEQAKNNKRASQRSS